MIYSTHAKIKIINAESLTFYKLCLYFIVGIIINKVTSKSALIGYTTGEIASYLIEKGHPKWRAQQISDALYRQSILSFKDIPTLSKAFKEELENTFITHPLQISKHYTSSDEVEKLLVHNGDQQVFECVLLPYPDRVSCCISSQIGCPMGCHFCATGLAGFDRNLTVSEIVSQVLLLQTLSTRRISHVVFMGMGEPLLNLQNILKSLRILHDEVGMSYRHMTVSTVGLVPQILELAKQKLPIHLALSLHSPFDEVRTKIMPVNTKWPVKEVVSAMREYQRQTKRKVTFEYLLIDNVNDTTEQAHALAQLLKGITCVVNLIPFNYVDTIHGFKRPQPENIRKFYFTLEKLGINVTQRVERGHNIAAACGQLAGQHSGKFAKREHLIPITSL